MGFIRSNVDPQLYMNKSAKGVIYVDLYADDNLMVGYSDTIDKALEAL